MDTDDLRSMRTQIRRDIINMVTDVGCGHPGAPILNGDLAKPSNWERPMRRGKAGMW